MSDKSNQAGQGGSGAAPATLAATPAPENPGKKFLDAFGPQGGVWFAENRTFEEAQNLYNESLKAANKALTDKVDDLQKRLDAAIAANGATNPASFDGKDGDDTAGEALAKLTKAFNGDSERAKRVLAQRAAKTSK